MSTDELEYYRTRVVIERDLADNCANPHVAEIHRKLADLYQQLIDVEAKRPNLSLVARSQPTYSSQHA
jgi:hypothetical protein